MTRLPAYNYLLSSKYYYDYMISDNTLQLAHKMIDYCDKLSIAKILP